MKKINLKNYEVEGKDEKGDLVKAPYEVKGSMVSILYHPDLKLGGRDLLLAHKLADKIESCKKNFILLEEIDYQKLKKAVDTATGFSKHDVEFVKRILEAEDVEVEEKDKGGKKK